MMNLSIKSLIIRNQVKKKVMKKLVMKKIVMKKIKKMNMLPNLFLIIKLKIRLQSLLKVQINQLAY